MQSSGADPIRSPSDDEYELLREAFRPRRVTVIFVGESRPANGTFFYRGDSRLAKYTSQAMGLAGKTPSIFLQAFRSAGYFLVDLCPEPVNRLRGRERRTARSMGEQGLTTKLQLTEPLAMVIVMKSIAAYVERAAIAARVDDVPHFILPFPAQGHEQEYVSGLRNVFVRLRRGGVLPI